nr:hypothetical protein [Kofleriaceae bacterium]
MTARAPRASSVAVTLAVALGGCQCNDTSAPATAGSSASAASSPQGRHPVKLLHPDAGPPPPGPKLAALTIAELQPYLPQLGDALVPLGMSPDGKQVRGAYCVQATDARAAADQIAADLTASGWAGAASRGEPPTTGVSADRDGLHFSVVIRGVDVAACPQAQHRFAANVTAFRLSG